MHSETSDRVGSGRAIAMDAIMVSSMYLSYSVTG